MSLLKGRPWPHFLPVQLRSGHYARNVGPLPLEDARRVSAIAQRAPDLVEALKVCRKELAIYASVCGSPGAQADMLAAVRRADLALASAGVSSADR